MDGMDEAALAATHAPSDMTVGRLDRAASAEWQGPDELPDWVQNVISALSLHVYSILWPSICP